MNLAKPSARLASEDVETGWTGGHNAWVIAAVVSMATFMEILDTSIANISLAHIAGSMGVSRSQSTWVLTSYLVANAVVIPVSGWLSQRLGRKRYYLMCVLTFTAASLLCGGAPSLEALVLFRVLQGIGGGGLAPVSQAILVDTFPPARRGMAMALYGMTAVLAPAIGPTLGGLITDQLSWRWVFLINVPVGVLAFFLSTRIISDPPFLESSRTRNSAVDWFGLGLLVVGLGLLQVALDKGYEEGWFDSPLIAAAIVGAVVSLFTFVVWEWDHPTPIVDVKMLKDRSFFASAILMMALGFTAYGATVLLPQYAHALMGFTAQRAGMILSPGGFVVLLMLPIAGRLVSLIDARLLITLGFTILAGVLLQMAYQMTPQMDFGTLVRQRCLQCVGFGCLFVPIQTIAYSTVLPAQRGQASGILNLFRNMGGDVGIASLATLIARHRQLHQTTLVSHLTGYDGAFRDRLEQYRQLFIRAGAPAVQALKKAQVKMNDDLLLQAMQLSYLDAVLLIALVAAAMVPFVWLVRRPAPATGAPSLRLSVASASK